MDKETLSFASAVPPEKGLLTYSFKDSNPKGKTTKFSLAYEGTMQHDCSNDVPPWTVTYYVNQIHAPRKLLAQGELTVAQADTTISVGVEDAYMAKISLPSVSLDMYAPKDVEDGATSVPTDTAPLSIAMAAATPPGLAQAAVGRGPLPAAEMPTVPASAAVSGTVQAQAPAPAPAPAPPANVLAGYVQQAQLQTQWCWAAVASSVAGFYAPNVPPNPDFTQCKLACWSSLSDRCCSDGSLDVCNQPQLQSLALQHVQHRHHSSGGRLSFAEICDEIDAGRPIAVTVLWTLGGGHALVITGYATLSARPHLQVQDPAGAVVALDDFPDAGSWNWTVTTCA